PPDPCLSGGNRLIDKPFYRWAAEFLVRAPRHSDDLPQASSSTTMCGKAACIEEHQTMKKAQTAPKVIVIIDDDLWVLEAMSGLLKSWGHKVVSAATDDAALDQLAESRQRPDLIICDYRLADGRIGIDAIERMRKAFGPPAFLITAEAAPRPLAEAGA